MPVGSVDGGMDPPCHHKRIPIAIQPIYKAGNPMWCYMLQAALHIVFLKRHHDLQYQMFCPGAYHTNGVRVFYAAGVWKWRVGL